MRQDKTLKQIADELGVVVSTIQVWVKKHDIEKPTKRSHNNTYVEVLCSECGSPFIRKLRYFVRRVREGQTRFYCRRKCVDKMVSREQTINNNMKGKVGELNPSWKGGVSGINEYLRESIREWKLRVLREYNFACFVTGVSDHALHVHHVTPFHELRDRAFRELGIEIRPTISEYTRKELEAISEKLVQLHEEEKGYAVRGDVHQLFHQIYGFKTTEEDFLRFKSLYQSGEIEEVA